MSAFDPLAASGLFLLREVLRHVHRLVGLGDQVQAPVGDRDRSRMRQRRPRGDAAAEVSGRSERGVEIDLHRRTAVIVAVSMPCTVPSTQFATHAVVPNGVSAMPVGSNPTLTSVPLTGASRRPVTDDDLLVLAAERRMRRPPAGESRPAMAPRRPGPPRRERAQVRPARTATEKTETLPASRLTTTAVESSDDRSIAAPRLEPGSAGWAGFCASASPVRSPMPRRPSPRPRRRRLGLRRRLHTRRRQQEAPARPLTRART